MELLGRAPDPTSAANLSRAKITAALRRARRQDPEAKAERIYTLLRVGGLRQPPAVEKAYATIVASQVRPLSALVADVSQMEVVVGESFGRHTPSTDAEIYLSQPGLRPVLGARVLCEFGDDPHRYVDAKARKNYAGTSPITRASGKKTVVLARYALNDRLANRLPTPCTSGRSPA